MTSEMSASARAGGALVGAVRAGLAAVGDPARAAQMQAYMRSAMPYRGVPSPQLKRLLRGLFAVYPIDDWGEWERTVRRMWDGAEHREEWYAAIALSGVRQARPWQDPSTLAMYEHMIVTGAWWDVVDDIASHRVGPILLAHPDEVAPVLRAWARDENLWRRRTAVIAQLGAKADTDVALLDDVLRANLLDGPEITRDFFLRKAVGWALRQHARVDPEWVRAFVAAHREVLSPLSIREATKHL